MLSHSTGINITKVLKLMQQPPGLQQLIPEPTQIITDPPPRIDLIFTSQPNLVMEPGTIPHFIKIAIIN